MIKNKDNLAIIWDYDGTLVNSPIKNLNVTRKIIKKVTGLNENKYRALHSLDNYNLAHRKSTNWREFYKTSFALSEEQVDEAGRLWTEYQLTDKTPVLLYDGIEEVLNNLAMFPQGIVSQNSKNSISTTLDEKGLLSHFRYIVGYEEVDLRKQKPAPDGLLLCIEKLANADHGCVFYIGDHKSDVQCVINANQHLIEQGKNLKIVSIAAHYGGGSHNSQWTVKPDYIAYTPQDITGIIDGIYNP